jgi:hypothetical protein
MFTHDNIREQFPCQWLEPRQMRILGEAGPRVRRVRAGACPWLPARAAKMAESYAFQFQSEPDADVARQLFVLVKRRVASIREKKKTTGAGGQPTGAEGQTTDREKHTAIGKWQTDRRREAIVARKELNDRRRDANDSCVVAIDRCKEPNYRCNQATDARTLFIHSAHIGARQPQTELRRERFCRAKGSRVMCRSSGRMWQCAGGLIHSPVVVQCGPRGGDVNPRSRAEVAF